MRLPRSASLKHRSLIRRLFQRDNPEVISNAVGCIRILARIVPVDESHRGDFIQAGFATGRRKNAVERNRIKRLLREAYRVRRSRLLGLISSGSEKLTLMIVFRGTSEPTANIVATDMDLALTRLSKKLLERRSPGD